MIKLKNIHLEINEKKLFCGLDLSINHGEKYLIYGNSGCGKSTLLKVIVGLTEVMQGEILVDNQKLTPMNLEQIRNKIAFLYQDPIMGEDNVLDALLLPFSFYRNKKLKPTQKSYLSILDKVRLSSKILKQSCNELSGGERQRIAIARALLMQRPILLADEVTSALDQNSRDIIVELLLTLEDCSVISVSHDPAVISAFPNIFELKDGILNKETGNIL